MACCPNRPDAKASDRVAGGHRRPNGCSGSIVKERRRFTGNRLKRAGLCHLSRPLKMTARSHKIFRLSRSPVKATRRGDNQE